MSLAINKRARYDYEILERFEAGLVLLGHEVKSVRDGKMVLAGSHVIIRGGEAWLVGSQIAKYPFATVEGYDPVRTRKLLLHKKELAKIAGRLDQKGLTLVPISVYSKGSKMKIEFGLARGKKQFEKRDAIKKRDLDREIRRSL